MLINLLGFSYLNLAHPCLRSLCYWAMANNSNKLPEFLSDFTLLDPCKWLENFAPSSVLNGFRKFIDSLIQRDFDFGQLLMGQQKYLDSLMNTNRPLLENRQKRLQRQCQLISESRQKVAAALQAIADEPL